MAKGSTTMASFLAGLGYYDHKSECLTRVGCNLVVTASVVLAITILFVSPQNGHASSTESPQLDPCDDFYEYVCQNESESIGQEHFANYYKDLQIAFDKLAIMKLHGLPVGYHGQPNYVILIRDLYLECINQSSETVPIKLAEACLKEIQHDHIEVVLRIYADYVSNGSRSYLAKVKEKAIHLAKLVNETFMEMLTGDQSWLDAVTKARVKEKLKLIRPIIAYPDLSYDDDLLNFLYGIDYLPFIRNETFKSYIATNVTPKITPWQYLLTENYTESKRLLSERKFDGYWYLVHSMKYEQRQVHYEFHDWKDVDISAGSHFVDQHYTDSISLLHIPLFELKPPYFDLTYPAIGNFAILGTILGHELTHGFDRQFRSYGFPPKMVYSDEAWIKFLDRANCLSRQYYQLPIDAKNPEFSFMVDGIDTFQENIADHGGIMVAFYAMKKHLLEHDKMEPLLNVPWLLSHFTPEQTYFIVYAQTWCKNASVRFGQTFTRWLPKDNHASPWHRVNEPLKNFDEFAKAFNCPPNSTMNPLKKCNMWPTLDV